MRCGSCPAARWLLWRRPLRTKGRRIVTINGSFDLLHAGHLFILSQARQQEDVLIVGLNSDASVKGYKGDERPLVSERQRAEMLLALRTVDYVHIFDELNPIAFLNEVKPDVHVNGAEYGADCIESETVRLNGAGFISSNGSRTSRHRTW
jgi:D-glycero-beta-D-manno-heptose 1-phosphate adenylyltransferase